MTGWFPSQSGSNAKTFLKLWLSLHKGPVEQKAFPYHEVIVVEQNYMPQ